MEVSTKRHPLQQWQSPSRSVSALVHVAGLVSFVLSFKYLMDFPSMVNDAHGWHFQYLFVQRSLFALFGSLMTCCYLRTICGLALATITFGFGLLADITASSKMFAAKNLMSVASTPLEVLISILYWSIVAIDRKLLMPEFMVLNFYADIGFHAIPAIVLMIDLLFLSPPWTIRPLPTLALSSTIAIGYWVWIDYCYSLNGWYPYPLFEILDVTQRAGLFGFSAIVMSAVTLLKKAYLAVNSVEGLQKIDKKRA